LFDTLQDGSRRKALRAARSLTASAFGHRTRIFESLLQSYKCGTPLAPPAASGAHFFSNRKRTHPVRSTRASAAVERLNKRLPEQHHSMVRGSDNLFHLIEIDEQGVQRKLCEPMEMDDFVSFVNGLGPQKVQRVSKIDEKFEQQLHRSRE
jgi:hypothetical protein